METCRCGKQATSEGMCDRCRYYASVFTPEKPLFESKRDIVLRSIFLKKMMKGKSGIMVVR